MSNVIPLPNAHAPRCVQCGRRMRMIGFHPDPNSERYVFEHFRCADCGLDTPHVRPVASREGAETPAVVVIARRNERAPAIVAGAPEPSRFG